MPLIVQRAVVALKIEGTPGQKETLGAADAFLVENPNFEPVQEMGAYDPVRITLSQMPQVPGRRSGRFTFRVPLKGSGVAGTAPEFGELFKACGLSETVITDVSVTYAPASENLPTVTVGYWLDGVYYETWGAMGTFRMPLAAGAHGGLECEVLGADWAEADQSLLSGATFDATVPRAFVNAAFTIGGFSADIEKLEIDMGNELNLRPSANAASGHATAVISNRRPTVSFDPENVKVATKDFMTAWKDGSLAALSAVIDGGAGNKVTVSAPKVQYTDIKLGARAGVSTKDVTGLLTMDSGDDELEIKFE